MSPILCKAPYNNLILFRLLIKHKTDDHKHNRNRYGKRKHHRRAHPEQKAKSLSQCQDSKDGKITNATVLRIPSGALLFRRYPIRSPITSAAKSPSEQASHTTTAELSPSLAPNVIAVSCVLSPSSATKMYKIQTAVQI